MALEPALRVSGRILAAVFIPAALVLTLLLFAGSTLISGVFSIPQAAVTILHGEGFYQQIAPAILTAALDSLPDTVVINTTTVSIAPLAAALRQADPRQLAQQIVPREWVQQQIASAIVSAVTGAGGDQAETSAWDRIALIRRQLTGDRAARLADLVLETARACTQSEVSRLRLLRDVRRDGLSALAAVDFVCAPPADTGLGDIMRDVIVVALAHTADNLTSRLADHIAGIDLSNLGVNTPVGRISLAWPGVQLAMSSFTLVYWLPADARAPVEAAAAQMRDELRAVSDRATHEVEQARQNLDNLRSFAAPAPAPAASATPVPTATPPTPTVEPPALADAGGTAGADVAPAWITGPLASATSQLAQQGAALGRTLALVSGLLLLLTAFVTLHLLRTIRALGLWAGAVLLLSGLLLLRQPVTVTVPQATAASALPPPIAALWADAAQAIALATQQQTSDPLQSQGIILVTAGAALLLAALFVVWRARQRRAVADTTSAA